MDGSPSTSALEREPSIDRSIDRSIDARRRDANDGNDDDKFDATRACGDVGNARVAFEVARALARARVTDFARARRDVHRRRDRSIDRASDDGRRSSMEMKMKIQIKMKIKIKRASRVVVVVARASRALEVGAVTGVTHDAEVTVHIPLKLVSSTRTRARDTPPRALERIESNEENRTTRVKTKATIGERARATGWSVGVRARARATRARASASERRRRSDFTSTRRTTSATRGGKKWK